MHERRRERAQRARRRDARCAGSEPSAFSSRGTTSSSRVAASSARRSSPSSSSSTSGLRRTVTGVRTCSRPATFAAPKPGLPVRRTTRAPWRSATAAPSSVDPESTTTSSGAGAQVALHRAQQHLELGRGVVQDDEQRRAHRRRLGQDRPQLAARRGPTCVRGRVRRRARRARCAAPGRRRRRPIAAASAALVARRHEERAVVAERLAQHRQVARRCSASRSSAASSGGNPKPSRWEGRTSASAPASSAVELGVGDARRAAARRRPARRSASRPCRRTTPGRPRRRGRSRERDGILARLQRPHEEHVLARLRAGPRGDPGAARGRRPSRAAAPTRRAARRARRRCR